MAKKSASKTASGSSASKSSKPAKKAKAASKAPAEADTVNVGLYGMAKIVRMVHEAGLESDLNEALGSKKNRVVQVDRKSFDKLRKFVGSKPEFVDHPIAKELVSSDCDPDDPYDICFGHHSSFTG